MGITEQRINSSIANYHKELARFSAQDLVENWRKYAKNPPFIVYGENRNSIIDQLERIASHINIANRHDPSRALKLSGVGISDQELHHIVSIGGAAELHSLADQYNTLLDEEEKKEKEAKIITEEKIHSSYRSSTFAGAGLTSLGGDKPLKFKDSVIMRSLFHAAIKKAQMLDPNCNLNAEDFGAITEPNK